jgi:cell division transport system permease protein
MGKLKGFFKIKSTVVSTVFGMSLLLFTMGVLAVGVLGWSIFEKNAKQNSFADVTFRESAREVDVLKKEKEIAAITGIREAIYVSPDSAQALMMERMGEDAFEILDGAQAFKPSITVKFESEYINVDSVESFKNNLLIGNEELIESVDYNKKQFAEVSSNFSNLKFPILIIAGMLLVISIILIYNTIRLAVFSKRFTIKTMQLVGAKSNFIRRPFLKAAIGQGFVSGVLAVLLLLLFAYIMTHISMQWVQLVVEQFELLKQEWVSVATIVGGLVVLGIFISFISTYFALNKYIWIKTDKLY